MTELSHTYDRAVHSDYLIHWTGKDIDQDNQPNWYEDDHRSKTPLHVDNLYLQRLRDILTFGLWMTEDKIQVFEVGSNKITIPPTPQCCFTELKLSESRRHARHYGRLGIGVKRPFLFQRLGRPLAYFGFSHTNYNDRFLDACAKDLKDKRFLNFFKPMNRSASILNYDLYSESEWRIIYFDDLVKRKKIIDPRDSSNIKEHEYFTSLSGQQQDKLKYLIPLDGWFAMIIYPSLSIRNSAQWDKGYGISDQIRSIKNNPDDHGNQVEGTGDPSMGSLPIEVNLDSCRNF